MLEMRPDCEACGGDLPAEAPGAFICSFECTFCTDCTAAFAGRCPNCGGDLVKRPTRAKALHSKYPSAPQPRFQP